MPLNATDLNWDFFYVTESPWPIAHQLNPFFIMLIFNCWWLVLLVMFFWESFEYVLAVIFKNSYGIFIGENGKLEPIGDTLVGDILNGIIGIILAYCLISVCKMNLYRLKNHHCCQSCLNFWDIFKCCDCHGRYNWRCDKYVLKSIKEYICWRRFKQFILYILWCISLSPFNLRIHGYNVGVYIAIFTTTIFFIFYYLIMGKTTELLCFWADLKFCKTRFVDEIHFRKSIHSSFHYADPCDIRVSLPLARKRFKTFVLVAYIISIIHLLCIVHHFGVSYFVGWMAALVSFVVILLIPSFLHLE